MIARARAVVPTPGQRAGFFALGAYLQIGVDLPRHDLRKPLIIMGAMAAFLSLWGFALWMRSRR